MKRGGNGEERGEGIKEKREKIDRQRDRGEEVRYLVKKSEMLSSTCLECKLESGNSVKGGSHLARKKQIDATQTFRKRSAVLP